MTTDNDARQPDIVSFDDEPLIVVDSDDNVLGHMPKVDAHIGQGTLHRAFSIFLFNDQSEVLMQQRAPGKPLWGGFWSNSVCSHPRRGETPEEAARRRLQEEIGIEADTVYLYTFEYHAQFNESGAEHEMCSVFVAHSNEQPSANPTEISEFAFMTPEQLDRELAQKPDRYTPWLKMEWPSIRERHWDTVREMLGSRP